MAYTDEELYSMSDEELEAAFKEAKADESSPEDSLPEPDEDGFVAEPETEEIMLDEADELEQPEEESDDDASFEDEEEDESEEDSETDEDDLDGDTDLDEEETDEDEDESKDDEQPVQKLKYKANGHEYEFTPEEVMEKFGQVFAQAQNYTQKMQTIKPWRKTIDAIEQAELSTDDINLAIDVLKGDKEAIADLLKRKGIDALELDTDNTNYQPKDYGRNDTELAIKDIVDEIKGDKEYDITYNVLEKQWDEKSRTAFIENPEMIRQLHIDVKSGMFDTIAPMANKLKVYDGGSKSDLDYYKLAAQQYFDNEAQNAQRQQVEQERATEREKVNRVKTETQKRKAVKTTSAKRKAAAPTKKNAGGSKVIDYLDASDEAYEDWYKTLEASM